MGSMNIFDEIKSAIRNCIMQTGKRPNYVLMSWTKFQELMADPTSIRDVESRLNRVIVLNMFVITAEVKNILCIYTDEAI